MARRARRYRRNVDQSQGAMMEFMGKPGVNYVATMVNAKDHRLYDIVAFDGGENVRIVAPLPSQAYKDPRQKIYVFGRGYFSDSDEKELWTGEEDQTFYRSHTPSGVAKKKTGLGLLLYSGISLATVAKYGSGAGGIFSEAASRSAEASAWWARQVERGYAEGYGEQEEVEGTTYRTIYIDEDYLGFYDRDAQEAAEQGEFGEEMEEATNVEVVDFDPSEVEVTISVKGYIDGNVVYLPAANVAASRMVVAWDEDDDDLNALMEDVEMPPAEVLVQLDMSTVADPILLLNVWNLIDASPNIHSVDKRFFLQKVPPEFVRGLALDQRMLEEYGQQRLPLMDAEQVEEMVANPRMKHSDVWIDYFGEEVVYDESDAGY